MEGRSAFRLLSNDLEAAALDEVPALREQAGRIRAEFEAAGARLSALSGSGASYFGLFDEAGKARRAGAALRAQGLRARVARTLTLDEYRAVWGHKRVR